MFCQPKGEPSRVSDEEPSRKASQEAAPGRVVFQIGGGRTLQASGGVTREQKLGGKNALGLSGECKTERGPERQFGNRFGTKSFVRYPVGISKVLAASILRQLLS